MTDKPIDLKKGALGPLGGETPATTVPVTDPDVEAFLLGRPVGAGQAEPEGTPGERSGDPDPDEMPDPDGASPDDRTPEGPARPDGVKGRLLALFRKPARGPEEQEPADPDIAPDPAPSAAPETSGSATTASEAVADAELTAPPGPNAVDPEPTPRIGSGPRPTGALARLLGRRRAEQAPAAPDTAPNGVVPEQVAPDLSLLGSDPSGPEAEVLSAAAPGPKDRFLARMRLRAKPDPVSAPDMADPEGRKGKSARRKGGGPVGRGFPPIQVLIGWVGESSRRDVLEHARGFATDHLETLETAWIAMAEFRGGTLFEVHEGGNGRAYLPELIEAISRDPDQVLWVPSGTKLNRVVTFSIVEGRPFSMMLNEGDSARVRASGQVPVERTGRMRRLSPRGNVVLAIGATLFAASLTILSGSAFLASRVDQQPVPSLSYNAEILPHGQIVSLSDALREDRWVSRILFENGAWRAEFETFEDLVLPEDTGAAQKMIDEAVERDAILQSERERKVRELEAQ